MEKNKQVRLGREVTAQELDKLKNASLTGDAILENLDDLNLEIEETVEANGTPLPKDSTPKVKRKLKRGQKQMTLEQELEALNKQMDEKIKINTVDETTEDAEESETATDDAEEAGYSVYVEGAELLEDEQATEAAEAQEQETNSE